MIDFTDVPTSELVSAYNELSEALGHKPITKFADRPTAEKRTRLAISSIAPEKRPGRWKEAPANGEQGSEVIMPIGAVAKPEAEAVVTIPGSVEAMVRYFTDKVRTGTNRFKVIDRLARDLDKKVPEGELLTLLYGSNDVAQRGALSMVIKGVNAVLADINYAVVRSKINKEPHFALRKADTAGN